MSLRDEKKEFISYRNAVISNLRMQIYRVSIANISPQAAKKGYLKDTRTEDDFFRIGFLGLEDTPKYAFTEKADDNVKNQLFNLLDYKTPQARLDAFKEIQNRGSATKAREVRNELLNPKDPLLMEKTGDPNEDWRADLHNRKTREFITYAEQRVRDAQRAAERLKTVGITEEAGADTLLRKVMSNEKPPKPDAQALHEMGRAETIGAYRNLTDVTNGIGYAEKPYEMLEKVNRHTANIADEYDEAIKVVDWLNDAADSKIIKSMQKVSTKSKAFANVGLVLDAGVTYAERRGEGYGSEEAAKRTVVNTGTKIAFSWVCTKGGTALGAKIGTLICPGLGTAIGTGVGFAGGMLVDLIWGDKIADQIEENIFTTTPDENKYMIYT